MDVNRRLEIMDGGQIELATLQANTNSLGYRLTGEQGEIWCKLYNDCINELVKQRPDRFVGMATVPLQDPTRAAKVLEHSIINMKFRGAFIGTNVNGQYYNTRDFDPFWAKAQELESVRFSTRCVAQFREKKIVIKRLLLLSFLAVSLTASAAFGQLKKVRLTVPTVDIVTLPLKMAQAKGFYQKEGLEVEII